LLIGLVIGLPFSSFDGVFQQFGSSRGAEVFVRDTVALADERHAGFGSRLSEVDAVLGRLSLLPNGAGGLSVEGGAARAYITGSLVLNNNLNPFFPVSATDAEIVGSGIVADNSALVLAEFTNLHGNEFVGLHARRGAGVHYRYGRVDRTRVTSAKRSSAASTSASTTMHGRSSRRSRRQTPIS
jgi:hypothetical protein